MRILFYDTETTGLPNRINPSYGNTHSSNGQPRPVQVGWIITDGVGTVLSSRNLFVCPVDFEMPEQVSQFNGIYTEDLQKKGLDEHDVLKAFIADLRSCDLEVGHNVSFDRAVMASRYAELGYEDDRKYIMTHPAMDTMLESKEYYNHPRGKYPKLTELHRLLFGRDFDNAHDAMADITATKDCFFELVRLGVIEMPGSQKDSLFQ